MCCFLFLCLISVLNGASGFLVPQGHLRAEESLSCCTPLPYTAVTLSHHTFWKNLALYPHLLLFKYPWILDIAKFPVKNLSKWSPPIRTDGPVEQGFGGSLLHWGKVWRGPRGGVWVAVGGKRTPPSGPSWEPTNV